MASKGSNVPAQRGHPSGNEQTPVTKPEQRTSSGEEILKASKVHFKQMAGTPVGIIYQSFHKDYRIV